MADEYLVEDVSSDGPESLYEGRELLSWTIDEYVRHARGPVWYALAVAFGIGTLAYAVVTQNFLFAVIIIMFSVIMGLASLRDPKSYVFVVTDLGVGVGDKFFPFKEFKNFWVIYEPPHVKNVYLEFRRAAWPHLVVPLHDQNPLDVRETLTKFLSEDLSKDEEPFSDLMTRIFKI